MTAPTEHSGEANCETPHARSSGSAAPRSALGRLLADEPPGLARSSSRAWRALAMAEAGYGWEDIVVASRGWRCGPLPPARARALVMDLGGAAGLRGGG